MQDIVLVQFLSRWLIITSCRAAPLSPCTTAAVWSLPRRNRPSRPRLGFTGTERSAVVYHGLLSGIRNAGRSVRRARSTSRAPVGRTELGGSLIATTATAPREIPRSRHRSIWRPGITSSVIIMPVAFDYPNYDPAYICGSFGGRCFMGQRHLQTGPYTSSTLPETTSQHINMGRLRRRFELHREPIRSTSILIRRWPAAHPPTHTTLDGSGDACRQQPGSTCASMPRPTATGAVDQSVWIQRSVRVYVTSPAYYWLILWPPMVPMTALAAQLDGI